MAKKIEVIGNNLVLTDTLDNTTIEYPTGRVRYKDTPNVITFTYIDDSSQDNQFKISDILQSDGSPFASTADLISYLRSNTGFNSASGGSGAVTFSNIVYVNQSNVATTLGGVIDSTKNYFIDGIIDLGTTQITVPPTGITISGYSFDLSG